MAGNLDWQNTTDEVGAARPHTAILPFAVVERHGSHLPVGTDWIIVDAIARHVAESMGEGCYLLPTMPYGTSAGHVGSAGTLSLAPLTMIHVVRDLVEGLMAQGIRRVAVINTHGGAGESTVRPLGNYIVKTAVRQLNYDHADLKAIWVQPFTVAKQRLLELWPSAGEDIHAGVVETSLLLHLRADGVKGTGEDFVPDLSKEYLDYLPFAEISPIGVWGHPSLASAEMGEIALAAAVDATVAYIGDSFTHLDVMRGPGGE
jgi:creatinine amidohydrolase